MVTESVIVYIRSAATTRATARGSDSRLSLSLLSSLLSSSSSSSPSSLLSPSPPQLTTHPFYSTFRNTNKRFFSVKALRWCEPTNSSASVVRGVRGRNNNNNIDNEEEKEEEESTSTKEIIDKFGIVVATSKNRVIGINGEIPWRRIPIDRQIFKSLTHDKILIIGRNTYEECADFKHIDHTRFCIVISTTMNQDTTLSLIEDQFICPRNSDDEVSSIVKKQETQHRHQPKQKRKLPSVYVVRSFPEALEMAKQIYDDHYYCNDDKDDQDSNNTSNNIVCWIAGGQKIYEEALKHPNLTEIHLSVIDTIIDYKTQESNGVAFFPPKYRWDHKFYAPPTRVVYDNDPQSSSTTTTLPRSNDGNRRADRGIVKESSVIKPESSPSPGFEYFVYK